jgi:hypothetical protein
VDREKLAGLPAAIAETGQRLQGIAQQDVNFFIGAV